MLALLVSGEMIHRSSRVSCVPDFSKLLQLLFLLHPRHKMCAWLILELSSGIHLVISRGGFCRLCMFFSSSLGRTHLVTFHASISRSVDRAAVTVLLGSESRAFYLAHWLLRPQQQMALAHIRHRSCVITYNRHTWAYFNDCYLGPIDVDISHDDGLQAQPHSCLWWENFPRNYISLGGYLLIWKQGDSR
jgi:hypothetical protein